MEHEGNDVGLPEGFRVFRGYEEPGAAPPNPVPPPGSLAALGITRFDVIIPLPRERREDRPCRIPTHENGWRNDGGNLVCATCHPPAEARGLERLPGARESSFGTNPTGSGMRFSTPNADLGPAPRPRSRR